MELEKAIAAYRERITHVLSQIDPAPTDNWVKEPTDRLMAPFERAGSGLASEDAST
jgi:hypothetical protein